ncbi:hypothetical protein Cadr_000005535 [Camelus dromedarius]|uniref:Uncharacterized protein n=1 Tax=Camelus dromedarius TaxID=9838 RepID=A0A5N4E083_CAMDR|nr:hypothetical protein Cadr_000005535 [Camelus dromedarius]
MEGCVVLKPNPHPAFHPCSSDGGLAGVPLGS